jgi:hypothetical protein
MNYICPKKIAFLACFPASLHFCGGVEILLMSEMF